LREGFSFDPSEVKKAVTIKAVSSFKPSRLEPREYSEPITATYILDNELFSSELPVVSLTVDPHDLFDEHEGIYVPGIWYEEDSEWSGNYAQKGREYEKPATVDFFHNNGDLDFHQNIGIRINGRASRILPQKSLRLYSRSDYGQSRFYTNVFDDLPYNEFNLLLLRNAGQDYDAAFMRDGLMHELVKDRDVDVQAFQHSIVLINGEYWGIHNIREKHTPDYFNVKYNIRNRDLTVMKGFNEDDKVDFDIKSGSNKDKADYNDLLTYVEKNDMTNDENIEYVETQVDLDNFFNYVAYQVYFANADSFRNNLLIWRNNNGYEPDAPKGHDGRWRWAFFDLDWGMGRQMPDNIDIDPSTFNMMEFVTQDKEEMTLFREIIKNEKLQQRFIEIMLSLLKHEFSTQNVTQKIDETAAMIRPEMEQSIYRWENIESME